MNTRNRSALGTTFSLSMLMISVVAFTVIASESGARANVGAFQNSATISALMPTSFVAENAAPPIFNAAAKPFVKEPALGVKTAIFIANSDTDVTRIRHLLDTSVSIVNVAQEL